jgi:hypothetical protein
VLGFEKYREMDKRQRQRSVSMETPERVHAIYAPQFTPITLSQPVIPNGFM